MIVGDNVQRRATLLQHRATLLQRRLLWRLLHRKVYYSSSLVYVRFPFPNLRPVRIE